MEELRQACRGPCRSRLSDHSIVSILVIITMALLPSVLSGTPSAADTVLLQRQAAERHLRHLNKPAVKSIQSPDGDIIDCVYVYDQPAFDHPGLQNHTIQKRFTYHSKGLETKNKRNSKLISKPSQLWHLNGRCPKRTIAIRRTKIDDILRENDIKRFGKKNNVYTLQPSSTHNNLLPTSGHQHAIVIVEGHQYYGTTTSLNVWNPKLELINDFSLAQLWVLAGTVPDDLNSIEVGWQVLPLLYGDNNTRLFIYWTADAYRATGCYNLLCSGFVQTSSEIALGASISPLSVYNGSQYEITLFVWKDIKEGNWVLQFNGHVLGYWPSTIFSLLSDSASRISWGGEIFDSSADGQSSSTMMGSGHFPEEGFGKSSYIRNTRIINEPNGNLVAPDSMDTMATQATCYDIQSSHSSNWGNYFYYGGPGKNVDCR